VPEFLRLRFDEKTRALNACSFAVMTVFSSGISMYAMARLIQTLHVFDYIFLSAGFAAGLDLSSLDPSLGDYRAGIHLPRRLDERDLQRSAAVLSDHCRIPAAGADRPEECRRMERV
jgi:hypothetical protein